MQLGVVDHRRLFSSEFKITVKNMYLSGGAIISVLKIICAFVFPLALVLHSAKIFGLGPDVFLTQ